MRLVYGFDALCGWCFGFVPAMRAVREAHPDLPVVLAMPGLVTGARIGPYAEMETYIRGASQRLLSVTGRAPSAAFYDLIRAPGVRGDSGPPAAAIAKVAGVSPDRALEFAHAVIEAHFLDGADLNRPGVYRRLAEGLGLGRMAFDPDDAGTIARVQADGRRHGITSFPTLVMEVRDMREVMPSVYRPDDVVAWVDRTMAR